MFGLSFGEILVLGVMALIVIGPKQLPELARNIGRFMNDMKRATEGFTDDIKKQARVDFDLDIRRELENIPDAAPPPVMTETTPLPVEPPKKDSDNA